MPNTRSRYWISNRSAALRRLLVAVGFLLGAPAVLQAQPAPPQFVSYDRFPFGPGDRSLNLAVKLDPGDTTANTEIWVVYGNERSAVATGAVTSGTQPRGKARIISTDAAGVVRAKFIFPHTDHPTPNPIDRDARSMWMGRLAYYKVIKQRGSAAVVSPVVEFLMPDKLTIVNFGDSYASGEGAPYKTGNKWDDELCHRNGNSGQARAVKQVREEMRDTAIAFKNVACSGAQIGEGILLSQLKKTWTFEAELRQEPVKPQVQAAAEWLAENRYDELNIAMISGGGNDVGFADYVQEFLVLPNVLTIDDERAVNLRTRIEQDIPTLYSNLRTTFDGNFTYDKVLVSEYPDPLRGSDGSYCHQPLFFSPREEFAAIDAVFLRKLNSTIGNTISAFPKFQHVTGTGARTRRNGLCNGENPYFNNGLAESIAMQGDVYGIVHPTRTGHVASYQPVYAAALSDAIWDIRLKWARVAAEEAARKEALQAQFRRKLGPLPPPQPKIRINPAVADFIAQQSKRALPKPQPQRDAQLAALRAEAAKEAAKMAVPMDNTKDNRPSAEEK